MFPNLCRFLIQFSRAYSSAYAFFTHTLHITLDTNTLIMHGMSESLEKKGRGEKVDYLVDFRLELD
jgi:hypothetical protein